MYVCCFALASVTYQSKLAAVFNLSSCYLSMCFTFPKPTCTLQSHHPQLSNSQTTKAQYPDYQPPIFSACITLINEQSQ